MTEATIPAVWLVMDLEAKKRGSIEAQLFALARQLHEARIAITFVFSNEPPAWMRAELAASGVTVRALDFRRPARAALTLAHWLDDAPPALVHFHFVRAYSPLVAVARWAGARVLVHDHMALGFAFVEVARRPALVQRAVLGWKRARAALLNRLVDRRIAVSAFVADSVEQAEFVPRSRIALLEHGIDLRRFGGVEGGALRDELGARERPLVACVSRMAPEKGVDVLIRAHARVGREALLVIAGDGPDAARCRALAAALGIEERVRFLGLRSDVAAILAACDVAVAPSLAPEAFGLAVVEAMAAGKPVVVSDAGAMPDLIDHGRCGTVVPPGDEVALADAIGRLLDGPVFAAALGAAGRLRAHDRYSLPMWVARLTALYAELVPALRPPLPQRHASVA